MIIIPAIDIKGGRCVRLTQGRMADETVYSSDPAEVAQRWEAAGAELIHLVDLDGAVEGEAKNFEVIKRIAASVKTPVQIGGGIRDMRVAGLYLDEAGVRRVIIGTAALTSPGFLDALTKKYPGRVAVGIDAKDGRVAIKGWVEVTDERASSLARRLEGRGAACIIYTDISRDGMLSGPNVGATAELARSVNIPVVASGGISSVKDIESYAGVPLEGIIVGKALYAEKVDLKEAIAATKRMGA
ncbi:MAG: 1-(5-phosphoribosyl)-5-[(5-phosphoribosylamino)methylideneamino]imidazole-4-carboxamide isomerase [Deltaproteobacteria bacterium]|nr:1-(5-phosphoribosyl)-5-[(5-phosphoribosylamino)methylideneamino]imidazole-4-carboxamide isomerase [Deltaproteobacteria bacterium]